MMKTHGLIRSIFTAAFCCFALVLQIVAQNNNAVSSFSGTLVLGDEHGRYPLGLHLELLEDPTGLLTLEDVTSPPYTQQFVPNQTPIPNVGLTNSVYWARFSVKDQSRLPHTWLLEMSYYNMNRISLYMPSPENDGFIEKHSGNTFPVSEREAAYQFYVFELPFSSLPPSPTFYLRFQNDAPMAMPLTLWTTSVFFEAKQREQLVNGLFYGMLVIMVGYNFFLFLSLRDKNYVHYVLFILSFILFYASFEGLAHLYLWPDSTRWAPLSIPVFAALWGTLGLRFSSHLLKTHTQLPAMHRLFVAVRIMFVLFLLGIPFLKLTLILPLGFVAILSSLLLQTVAGIILLIQGYRPARYYVFAWSFYVCAIFITALTQIGVFPRNVLTDSSIEVGIILLVLLLSFALADRIRSIRLEKEEVQAELLRVFQENTSIIQEQNIRLEQRVRERTEELLDAKEKAEIASQAKSTFIAHMSHELRTPLSAILGFAQILKQSELLHTEQQEYVTKIVRSGKHLLTLINQILDVSNIETGKMSINVRDVNLHRLLDDIQQVFSHKAREKQLSLTAEYEPDLPRTIRTDEDKLRYVLQNVLDNAVKFTKEGGIILKIEDCQLKIEEEGNHRNAQSSICNLQFSILDSGPGIAPEELAHLFEAFTLTETGRQANTGKGLGLWMCRKFVELLGGEMSVQSEEGKGTEVTFHITAEVSVAKDETPQPHRQSGDSRKQEHTAESDMQGVLTPDALAELPEELLHELQQAVEALDLDRVNTIIERIRRENVPIAEGLAALAGKYRFDILQELFGKLNF